VLDPFAGSGTTPAVAAASGRPAVGIELNGEHLPLIRSRVEESSPAARVAIDASDRPSGK
jgi:DNA modification methylase